MIVLPLILMLADIETSDKTNKLLFMMVLPVIFTLADMETSDKT